MKALRQSTQPVAEPDMRMADCGSAFLPGWQLAWSQVIGSRHPHVSEDSLAHGGRRLAGSSYSGPQALCLAVADGVGGGARGDVASAALAAHCAGLPDELLGHPEGIAQWMLLAEGQVQLKLREVSYAPGAATLAAAWLLPCAADDGSHGVQGHILRVGDARLYQFDGETMSSLTVDQTYASVGELPPEGATRNDPARMVGTGFTGRLEVLPVALAPGDTLLLCSDGLHRGLDAARMAELLRRGSDLATCATQLAQSARMCGSDDDITVLLARVFPGSPAPASVYSGLVKSLRKIFQP